MRLRRPPLAPGRQFLPHARAEIPVTRNSRRLRMLDAPRGTTPACSSVVFTRIRFPPVLPATSRIPSRHAFDAWGRIRNPAQGLPRVADTLRRMPNPVTAAAAMEAVFFELPLLLPGELVEAIQSCNLGRIGRASRNRIRPRMQEGEHVSLRHPRCNPWATTGRDGSPIDTELEGPTKDTWVWNSCLRASSMRQFLPDDCRNPRQVPPRARSEAGGRLRRR